MYCQKCRTPLKLDGSLESLNPAAFDLLVGKIVAKSSGNPVQSFAYSNLGSTGRTLPEPGSTRLPYPQDRRELYDRVSKQTTSPVYKRTLPAPRHASGTVGSPPRLPRSNSGNMSFVMLTESQVVPPNAVNGDSGPSASIKGKGKLAADDGGNLEDRQFSDQVERTTRLFEIISSRSDIDHPVCAECTDMLLDGLKERLVGATKERDAYVSFYKELGTSIPNEEDLETAEKSLKETVESEEAAFAELLGLEQEKEAVDEEIAALEEESHQLDLEEEKFWRDRNAFSLTLADFQNERDALNMRYDHDSRQLERLQRTNVYNDAFCIGHDGYFGTINGLRLGRLANPSVEWPEINAAWGQTALLLATIADRLGFQFQGYRLRPLGSMSRIEKFEYPQWSSPSESIAGAGAGHQTQMPASKVTVLDLFSSGDLPLNLPWLHRRFDAGMVGFLECLRQLGEFVASTPTGSSAQQQQQQQQRQRRGYAGSNTAGLKLPYEIKKDKIHDASIKLGFNQNDETWTRACKYTLTCCKYLLAHTSNAAGAGSSSSTVAVEQARG